MFEFETRFSLYQQKYSEVRAELYKKLAIAEQEMKKLLWTIQIDKENTKVTIQETGNAFEDVANYFFQNKIYFDNEICNNIESILMILAGAFIQLAFIREPSGKPADLIQRFDALENINKLARVWDEVQTKLPQLKKQLEQQFRKSLVVERFSTEHFE